MIKPASGLASPSGLERLVQLSKVTIWNRVKKAFQILQGKMMGKALGWGGGPLRINPHIHQKGCYLLGIYPTKNCWPIIFISKLFQTTGDFFCKLSAQRKRIVLVNVKHKRLYLENLVYHFF